MLHLSNLHSLGTEHSYLILLIEFDAVVQFFEHLILWLSPHSLIALVCDVGLTCRYHLICDLKQLQWI